MKPDPLCPECIGEGTQHVWVAPMRTVTVDCPCIEGEPPELPDEAHEMENRE